MAANLLKELVFLNRIQYPPLPRSQVWSLKVSPNRASLPRVPDLSDPSRFSWSQPEDGEEWDSTGISHLFISSPAGSTDSTSRLGAWLMLPTGSSGRVEPLGPSDTVVLYLHGNAFNRSQKHRIALYRLLLSLGYYVLAIDYRGFGDSSPVELTENSVVADARAAVAWLTSKLGDCARVVVWGHSLGTAIATHMVAEFDLETGGNSPICGLVLESPFNNMMEEVATYKISTSLMSRFIDLRQLVGPLLLMICTCPARSPTLAWPSRRTAGCRPSAAPSSSCTPRTTTWCRTGWVRRSRRQRARPARRT
jgi:pimeloyl-ACP methyl ester carboxylesterase